jgi:hypothetical protein
MKKYILPSFLFLIFYAPLVSQAAMVSGEVRLWQTLLTHSPNTAKKAYILRKITEVKIDILAVDKLITTLEKKRDAAKKVGASTTVYDKKIAALKASKEALRKALALLEKQLTLLK